MIRFFIHVLSGAFQSQTDAIDFCTVNYNDEEEAAPKLKLSIDIGGARLSSDFVEAVYGKDRYAYLGTLLVDEGDLAQIQTRACVGDNTLFLIMELGDNMNVKIAGHRTSRTIYCGKFKGCFREE